jgi:hypothetical protein
MDSLLPFSPNGQQISAEYGPASPAPKKKLTRKQQELEQNKESIKKALPTLEQRQDFRDAVDAIDADGIGAIPVPLPELELPNIYDFPIEILGEELQLTCEAIAAIGETHIDIAVQSVLCALSLAEQSLIDVITPNGEIKPVSLSMVTVADSGDRKTTADRLAMTAVTEWEKVRYINYKKQQKEYEVMHKDWEKRKALIIADEKLTTESKLLQIGLCTEPIPPAPPTVRTQDPTIEGLRDLFVRGCSSLGLCTDDGADFLGGHAMQKDKEKNTIATLSRLWEAASWDIVRAGGVTHKLTGRRLSMHLMIQPMIAAELFNNELYRSQGILSRVLMAHPPSLSGSRYHQEIDPKHYANLQRFDAHLYDILSTMPVTAKHNRSELAPRRLEVTPEAKELWVKFKNSNQKPLQDGTYDGIKGWIEKSLDHATRIAALLSYWYVPEVTVISGYAFERACKAVEYYISQQLGQLAVSGRNHTIINAHKLYDWLNDPEKSSEEFVSTTYLMQRSPLRTKQLLTPVIELMEECNLMTDAGVGRMCAGKPTHKAWKVIRNVI